MLFSVIYSQWSWFFDEYLNIAFSKCCCHSIFCQPSVIQQFPLFNESIIRQFATLLSYDELVDEIINQKSYVDYTIFKFNSKDSSLKQIE